MDLGRLSVVVVLIIAAEICVSPQFFMHLKYEKGLWLFKLMIPGILVLLVLFIGITFLMWPSVKVRER
jgi:heme/copper-type cytochrome/quinol oxidase subunit 4